jgi:hypothetical protein
MKRTFLLAGLAIAVLFGASAAIIVGLTRPPATPAEPEPYESSAPIALPVSPGAQVSARLGPDGGREGEAARAIARARTRLLSPAPMADRVTQKAVRNALRAPSVESRLASCTRPWEFGGTTSEASRPPRPAPAFLVLELESSGSELRVVDSTVRSWGGASEAMVSCARTVLHGQAVPEPSKRRSAGDRMIMNFTLYPRREAVAAR